MLAFHSSCGDWLFRYSAIGDFAPALEQHMDALSYRQAPHSCACAANESLTRDDKTVIGAG